MRFATKDFSPTAEMFGDNESSTDPVCGSGNCRELLITFMFDESTPAMLARKFLSSSSEPEPEIVAEVATN
jgi:hypothetical protein